MQLFSFVKARNWPTVFGYGLFTGMMAAGYYYNVTFVQLGLVDLGQQIGMSRQGVATVMGLLAVLTCAVALGAALWVQRRGRSVGLLLKLRLAFAVVAAQTALTAVAPLIERHELLVLWTIAASLALGAGIPATFSLTVDLIPVRDRGYVAAAITAVTYFAAAVFSGDWTIDTFARQLVPLMLLGAVMMGVLASGRLPLVDTLALQHTQPEFASGRFMRGNRARRARLQPTLTGFFLLMFGVFFIDSLGFLRIIETPFYVNAAWQSSDPVARLFIGGTHVLAALIAGALYNALSERALFYWVFGIFALVHFSAASPLGALSGDEAPLGMPMFYAIAVSLYTVLNFALWADYSTPRTITLNVTIGVGLCGWAATFMSTALALQWQSEGMPVAEHLRHVDALALVFLLGMLAFAVLPWPRL